MEKGMAGFSRLIILGVSGFLFLACAEEAHQNSRHETPPHLDDRLSLLFESSCALCHIHPTSIAPQLGSAQWEGRSRKGFDRLLFHVIDGMEGMPPLGACATCSYEDLVLLTQYLARSGASRAGASP